jgi:hypothetical protein
MLRRVGSASAPNVRSSDTYLGMWLTICNDIEPVNSACRRGGSTEPTARRGWRASRRPSMACRWSPLPSIAEPSQAVSIAGHSRLTAGHRAPAAPPRTRRASRQPRRGEEASSPRTPPQPRPERHGPPAPGQPPARRCWQRVMVRWAHERSGPWPLVRNSARRRERNARFACLGCCYDPFGGRHG